MTRLDAIPDVAECAAHVASLTHLSPSAIAMALKCGIQYGFARIRGLKLPPGVALLVGGAAAETAELNRRDYLERGTWWTPRDAMAVAVGALDHRWASEPPDLKPGESRSDATDDVAAHAGIHAAELAPLVIPERIEQAITLRIEGVPVPIEGYVDVIGRDDFDGRLVVADDKTTGSATRWTGQADLGDSPQLGVYAAAVAGAEGLVVEDVVVGVLVTRVVRSRAKTPRPPAVSTVRLTADRPVWLVERAAQQARAAWLMISAGALAPAPEGAWWCAPKWCGYHAEAGGPCPFGRPGKEE